MPCKYMPEEFCLSNVCTECHELLKSKEAEIPISVPQTAIA